MQYLAEQEPPVVPEASKPRLVAALEEAKDAQLAMVDAGISEEVFHLLRTMHAAMMKFAHVYRDEFEFERWWSHHLYYELHGQHMDAPLEEAEHQPPEGEIINFADARRRALERSGT